MLRLAPESLGGCFKLVSDGELSVLFGSYSLKDFDSKIFYRYRLKVSYRSERAYAALILTMISAYIALPLFTTWQSLQIA